ncbi:amidase signature domain-containing protein [Apiospora sp. TS-2023a]
MYKSSKYVVTSLTKMLQLELALFIIKVVNLVTGGVKCNFYKIAADIVLSSDSMCNVAKGYIEKTMMSKETIAAHAVASD